MIEAAPSRDQAEPHSHEACAMSLPPGSVCRTAAPQPRSRRWWPAWSNGWPPQLRLTCGAPSWSGWGGSCCR